MWAGTMLSLPIDVKTGKPVSPHSVCEDAPPVSALKLLPGLETPGRRREKISTIDHMRGDERGEILGMSPACPPKLRRHEVPIGASPSWFRGGSPRGSPSGSPGRLYRHGAPSGCLPMSNAGSFQEGHMLPSSLGSHSCSSPTSNHMSMSHDSDIGSMGSPFDEEAGD